MINTMCQAVISQTQTLNELKRQVGYELRKYMRNGSQLGEAFQPGLVETDSNLAVRENEDAVRLKGEKKDHSCTQSNLLFGSR